MGDGDALFAPDTVTRFNDRMAEGLAETGFDIVCYNLGPGVEKESA